MTTKELIQKFNIRANKNFGQNFLVKEDVMDTIATSINSVDCVLEIGAGLGVLTKKLCDNFKKAVTIEIDRSLEAVTSFCLEGVSNHNLVYQDFLKTDLKKIYDGFGSKFAVIGNLPYNITGDIITKLIKNSRYIDSACVMVQKEAAQKFAALPTDDEYRAISVLVQSFCKVSVLVDVAPDGFIPPPHVMSRVIKLEFYENPEIPPKKQSDFFAFVHRVFSARRKFLTAVFKDADDKQKVVDWLCTHGFSEKTRGENLNPDQFVKLFNYIY